MLFLKNIKKDCHLFKCISVKYEKYFRSSQLTPKHKLSFGKLMHLNALY